MIKILCIGINEVILILKLVIYNIYVCKKYVEIGLVVLLVKLFFLVIILFDNVNLNINDILYIEIYF